MDDTEPFGRFNRAQRAVQNHMEQARCGKSGTGLFLSWPEPGRDLNALRAVIIGAHGTLAR